MRVLLWHGWLLEGAGTNVFTARVAETLRTMGHDVALLCQERHPERYPWIDAWGTVDADGPSELIANTDAGSSVRDGRCVLLRPAIGSLLPVFVIDEYEGFDEVQTFVALTDAELDAYLARNVDALRAAVAWHDSETVYAGHAVPGGPVAARALAPRSFLVKTAGSDIEYAIRPQARYRRLAAEGIGAARALIGPSADVLMRATELTGQTDAPTRLVTPGVDAERFHPMDRRAALLDAAGRLDADAATARGRPSSIDEQVVRAIDDRDADALDRLAHAYDQQVPDPDAAARLRSLADREGPLVGFIGKLIPQKGVQLLLAGAALARSRPDVLIVGFGLWREQLAALAIAIARRDVDALAWLRAREVAPDGFALGGDAPRPTGAEDAGPRVTFTGRLDHRYAPEALAAMDVLVVPSILEEAFGMVVAEGAAAGALPLVARHSGLAEVAASLEAAVGRHGPFGFEPGPGAALRVAEGIDRLLELNADERRELREAVADAAARSWSWEQTAARLLL